MQPVQKLRFDLNAVSKKALARAIKNTLSVVQSIRSSRADVVELVDTLS